MAGPKGSKYYDILQRHQVEMVSGDEILISEEGQLLPMKGELL